MKKYCLDLTVKSVEHINDKYVLLKLTDENPLPEMIPGQFVEIQVDGSKTTFLRRPISINDVDREDNTLHLLIACIGDGTRQLGTLTVGAKVNIVLPLGNGFTMPASPEKKHLLVGGGVGVAPLLPIVKAMHNAGNKVIVVLAARTKDLIILEDEMRANSDEIIIMTDDGSYGQKGVITVGVEQVIQREKVDKVVCIGPTIMMKFVSLLTQKYNVSTVVSLNTIMVDGTGMCGACRVTVGGKTRFVCVDGPEFDAAEVNFDEMMMRMRAYKAEETEALACLNK